MVTFTVMLVLFGLFGGLGVTCYRAGMSEGTYQARRSLAQRQRARQMAASGYPVDRPAPGPFYAEPPGSLNMPPPPRPRKAAEPKRRRPAFTADSPLFRTAGREQVEWWRNPDDGLVVKLPKGLKKQDGSVFLTATIALAGSHAPYIEFRRDACAELDSIYLAAKAKGYSLRWHRGATVADDAWVIELRDAA